MLKVLPGPSFRQFSARAASCVEGTILASCKGRPGRIFRDTFFRQLETTPDIGNADLVGECSEVNLGERSVNRHIRTEAR